MSKKFIEPFNFFKRITVTNTALSATKTRLKPEDFVSFVHGDLKPFFVLSQNEKQPYFELLDFDEIHFEFLGDIKKSRHMPNEKRTLLEKLILDDIDNNDSISRLTLNNVRTLTLERLELMLKRNKRIHTIHIRGASKINIDPDQFIKKHGLKELTFNKIGITMKHCECSEQHVDEKYSIKIVLLDLEGSSGKKEKSSSVYFVEEFQNNQSGNTD